MNDLAAFGPDFVWGAATAAYQIEGAVAEDGRCPSIWDTFCDRPGAIDGGGTGRVACDHYHRWPEDVALMSALGLNAYRFSVAWPRVVPDGTVNAKGLDFYDRLVDALLAAGIRPFATLYHWDLPQALQDRGGWPERSTAQLFADYAAVVAARLGDRVTDWTTVNEPYCAAWIGHLEGTMAPGWTDLPAAVRASHHLLLGHGLATAAVRANATAPPSIGIVNILTPCEPATPGDEDAAIRADGHNNRWWLDPVTGHGYPADMIEVYGTEPPVHDGDLEVIAAPLDYLGVNYYRPTAVTHAPEPPGYREVLPPGAPVTVMDWEVRPEGLEKLLVRVAKDYGPQRLYVTENGAAYRDALAAGRVDDPERTAYLEGHLEACARAVRQGVPLDGYFAWSLLDNFEWAYGYDKRFGLVHVDYATQTRTIKASGHRYADLIRAHRRIT